MRPSVVLARSSAAALFVAAWPVHGDEATRLKATDPADFVGVEAPSTARPRFSGFPDVRDDLAAEALARVRAVTAPTRDFSKPENFELKEGGGATSRKPVNVDAFSQPSANLGFDEQERFSLGNALFTRTWVSAPSSTQASDGLGPLFNAGACQNCHLKDGRGHPPDGRDDSTSMFLRLSRAPHDPAEQALIKDKTFLNLPDKSYGAQLQDLAVTGLKPEGRMHIEYTETPLTLGDGSVVSLRKPVYSVVDLAYGPLDPSVTLSPRMAPPMIGLGLVEQIPEADILAHADPDDADGDGIAGRPNIVRNRETGQLALGRFGWKASTPTIRRQSAEALAGDIGISTPDVPSSAGECTEAQAACLAMPNGVETRLGSTEAPDPVMDLVTFYARNLAPPARRDIDTPEVLAGKRTFYEIGCASCHVPKFVTRRDAPEEALRFQLIWPYSDFLVHNMGVGLADWQIVGDARGADWRTPPLWGIGLTQTVSGRAFYLHDGRARSLTEAILWHGGEATKARDRYAALRTANRDALEAFLDSL